MAEADGVRALKVFPSLGDARKTYAVDLTEPEINAIHGVLGYCDDQIRMLATLPPNAFTAHARAWWNHYGPALLGLSARLQRFDDGDAPFQSANAENHQPSSEPTEERQNKKEKS